MALIVIGWRFVLGTIFLLAGCAKLPRRGEFEQVVRRYELVPPRTATAISKWLPSVEIGSGCCLLLGIATVPVAALLVCLLVVFAAAVSVNLLRGREISCGCHALGAPSEITWSTVGRNIVLIAMALLVALASPIGFELLPVVHVSSSRVSANAGFAALIASTLGVLALGLAEEALRLRRYLPNVRKETAAT